MSHLGTLVFHLSIPDLLSCLESLNVLMFEDYVKLWSLLMPLTMPNVCVLLYRNYVHGINIKMDANNNEMSNKKNT